MEQIDVLEHHADWEENRRSENGTFDPPKSFTEDSIHTPQDRLI